MTTVNQELLENEFELDPELMNDELEDGEQDLEDEAEAMLRSWDRDQIMKEVQEMRELKERQQANKDMDFYDGDQDFEEIAKDMTPLNGEKVFIKIIESKPDAPEIDADSTILYDSVSYLEFEPSPFASSIYEGKPSKLNLAEGPAIAGLIQALITMREGERAIILIHPAMAFGALGCFPLIPPNSSILYQVKVYKVWPNSSLTAVMELERREGFEANYEDIIKLVEEHKELANKYLKDNQTREAIIRYKMGIKRLNEIPGMLLERSNGKNLLLFLLINCALALNSLEMYKSASKYAKRALLIDSRSVKAYYHLIKSKIGTGDLEEALRQLERVEKITPNNPCFNKLKVEVDQLSHKTKQKRDEIARKMSQGIFSSN